MNRAWQLREARNRLSELIDAALHSGPQVIIRRGTETAVVISCVEYHMLKRQQKRLSDFFRESPLADLRFERDSGTARLPALE